MSRQNRKILQILFALFKTCLFDLSGIVSHTQEISSGHPTRRHQVSIKSTASETQATAETSGKSTKDHGFNNVRNVISASETLSRQNTSSIKMSSEHIIPPAESEFEFSKRRLAPPAEETARDKDAKSLYDLFKTETLAYKDFVELSRSKGFHSITEQDMTKIVHAHNYNEIWNEQIKILEKILESRMKDPKSFTETETEKFCKTLFDNADDLKVPDELPQYPNAIGEAVTKDKFLEM